MRSIGKPGIAIGACAGHHFWGDNDLEVVYHCTQGAHRGYFHRRKWLANRAAFNYDPRLGWAYDNWFEWFEGNAPWEPIAKLGKDGAE